MWLKSRLSRGAHTREELLKEIEKLALESPRRPLFLPAHLPLDAPRSPDDLLWIQQHLDPDRFAVVRPDQLMELARAWYNLHPWLKTPSVCATVEQVPTLLQASLANASTEAQTYTCTATGGQVSPGKLHLAPNALGKVRLVPSEGADALVLRIQQGAISVQRKLKVVHIPHLALPPGVSGLALYALYACASQQGHRFGHSTQAVDAWQAEVWSTPAAPHPLGHLLFGPYVPLAKGDYVAIFRLQAPAGASGELGNMDVYCEGDELAAHTLDAADLARPGWHYVPLYFHTKTTRHGIEFRLELTTPDSNILADTVAVFKLLP